MAKLPPPLPSEIFENVLRIATRNGRILLFLSGGFALLSAIGGSLDGAKVGCLAAGAGALELHGAGLILHGEKRGVSWLVGSQILLLVIMLLYCAAQILQFDAEVVRSRLTPELLAQFDASARVSEADLLHFVHLGYSTLYVVIAVVSVIYQGGMALFYRRSRSSIAHVLAQEFEAS